MGSRLRARAQIVILCFALLLSVQYGPSAIAMEPSTREWSAVWVGVQGESYPNQWISFRRSLQLTGPPRSAIARIAVDSKYWLWINGELVVFEGQLKRGPTPRDTYYDELDLTPYLKPGNNTLAVLVWHFGKHGFSHKNSGKAGLLFEAEIDGIRLLSDETWKAIVHPSFGDTGEPHPNFRLPESNIRFDASKEPVDWTGADFDDSSWPAAVEYCTAPCSPWHELTLRPIPLWKNHGLSEYLNAEELPEVSTGEKITARLPYNAQITPYLKIRARAGQLIRIQTDNYLGGGSPNVRAEYVTREGAQEYESLGWMNGHNVIYEIPKGVEILALKFRETGYATQFEGKFESDDSLLNSLWTKARRTVYLNSRDNYSDCPDRERAQWWDINTPMEGYYAFDSAAHLQVKKGILEFANWQRTDGTFRTPAPSGNWDKELPNLMLQVIGEYGIWNYFLHTGDLETIKAVYPQIRRYLDLWKLDADGLVIHRSGGWDWGDWGENIDRPILDNSWYFLALEGAIKMARATGHPEDIEEYARRARSIEAAFNERFWNGTAYQSKAVEVPDDRANAMAVVSGLADRAKWRDLAKVFETRFHASVYTERYVLQALFEMGFAEQSLARLEKRYREMVESPQTTLWEDWRIGGSGGGTLNHGWSGMLSLLSQKVAGIMPLEPGFERVRVSPSLGPLKRVSAVVPTVKGNISVDIERDPLSYRLTLTSPEGTTSIVGLPYSKLNGFHSVTINEEEVWNRGKAADLVEGVRFQEQKDDRLVFSVSPGHWVIRGLRKKSDEGLEAAH